MSAMYSQYASAAKLTVDNGVVVKFGPHAGMTVRQGLQTSRHVVLTSEQDDTAGNQTQAQAGTPKPGDWQGLKILDSVVAGNLQIDRLKIRYAGADDAAALEVAQSYNIQSLDMADNALGIRVLGAAHPTFSGLSLTNNTVGLESREDSSPVITGADVSGNTQFGVLNVSPQTLVQATDVWWGDASGPTDAVGNPSGTGDPVSAGVNYGSFSNTIPLIDCSLAPVDGNATVATSNVTLALECRNATEYRLALDGDFGSAPYQPMSTSGPTTAQFSLTGAAGDRSISVEYQATTLNVTTVSFVLHYQPDAPVVTITSPATDAVLTTNTTIAATVSDAAGTDHVDFYIDAASTSIATVTSAPYETVWSIDGVLAGQHDIKVVATSSNGQTGQAVRQVTVHPGSNDTTGPVISNIQFAGVPLADGATLSTPGLLTFDATDHSGVASGAVQVGATAITGGGFNSGQYSTLLDFGGIVDGTYNITLRAVDSVGNPTEQVVHNIVVAVPAPPAPVLLVPTDGAVTPQPRIAVSGSAQAGSSIQLYLGGSAAGAPIPVAYNGTFNATVTLPNEGASVLTATATNSRGTGPTSAAVSITWTALAPTVVITSPPANAVLDSDGPVSIDASIIDPLGISAATLTIDGQPFGQPLSAAPYTWSWDTSAASAGAHHIEVSALNVVGKSAAATRSVSVMHTPPPPPPVQTAYTGHVDSISPATSYGDQPIVITGSAVDRTSGAAVPNALLKVVLQINGFQRRIATSTNADGQFSFTFVPQDSDAGVYVVSVIHPEETDVPDQGQFTINRLSLRPTSYALHAARTIPNTITITASASAGQGTSGVHLAALPAKQPSGALPAGITVDTPAPADVPAGGSTPINVVFTAGTASEAPDPTGTVVLTAVDGSGHERGNVTINYTLSEPQASLLPQPSSIQTGVARGKQMIEAVKLSNQGLAAATNVKVTLGDFTNAQSQAVDADSLLYLSSPSDVGDIAVGATQTVQIVVAPKDSVADGVYSGKLHVTADGIDGFVWVTIAVTSADTGGVKFLAKDIYTCIPDCATTPGLGGASISVQNEAVPTIVKHVTTSSSGATQGQAEIRDLPVGHYRYVATAPSHVTATGRITVQPGVSINQDVFLDYQLVTFEWSVTDTTIQDQYDVTLTATYEAQVPAPVILIEPASINLPNMQAGEEITGEVTITNYGLVRADNVVWHPAVSDQYYNVEFLGTPPDTLDAHQSVQLPYRITKTCTPLPGTQASGSCPLATAARASAGQPGHVFNASNKHAADTSGGTCYGYRNPISVTTSYQCAAGDTRNGAASASFNKAYGQCNTSSGGGGTSGGGNGGPPVGGWEGGGGGGPAGTPLSAGPGCVPVCPDCKGSSPGN